MTKPKGWRNKKPDDSFRHAQAARGIETVNKRTIAKQQAQFMKDVNSLVLRIEQLGSEAKSQSFPGKAGMAFGVSDILSELRVEMSKDKKLDILQTAAEFTYDIAENPPWLDKDLGEDFLTTALTIEEFIKEIKEDQPYSPPAREMG